MTGRNNLRGDELAIPKLRELVDFFPEILDHPNLADPPPAVHHAIIRDTSGELEKAFAGPAGHTILRCGTRGVYHKYDEEQEQVRSYEPTSPCGD